MRNAKINYFVVGVFVIAMVAGLVLAIATLSGRTGATDPYYAVYDNVTGVKFGTQVMYEGYPIGQVEAITPTAKDGRMEFRIDLSVRQGWKIPSDSVAEIAAPGLLSAITIAIAAGDSKTALVPGSQVKSRAASNIFAVMSSVAGDISDLAENSIKPLLLSLNQAVGGDGRLLLSDLRTITADLGQRIPRIADDIESFAAKVNRASDQASKLLSDSNRGKIEETIAFMDKSAVNLAQLTKDLNATRAEVDKLVVTMSDTVAANRTNLDGTLKDLRYVAESTARHIDSVNQNLEGTARNMFEFSRQIRRNPGLLLRGTTPDDKAKTN